MYQRLFVVLLVALTPVLASAEKSTEKKPAKRAVLGWEEKVAIVPEGIILHAKLDTGYHGTSVYAHNIKRIKEKKDSWVQFDLKDRYGNEASFERKVIRRLTLKSAGNRIRTEYVVELGICLGGKYFEDEISLSDREAFSQELRLGRQSLEGHFVVDPALTHTTKPDCEFKKEKKKKRKKEK